MKKFLLGIVVTLVVFPGAAFVYLRLGLLNTQATLVPSRMEAKLAGSFRDASVSRRAPDVQDPIEVTPANLVDGIKIYRQNCAVCHGEPAHPVSSLILYPRAPQFMNDPPDMPANQNFYITKYGVRWTGMPSWKNALSDEDIWKVVTFFSQFDRLPPEAEQEWKAPQPAEHQEGAKE